MPAILPTLLRLFPVTKQLQKIQVQSISTGGLPQLRYRISRCCGEKKEAGRYLAYLPVTINLLTALLLAISLTQ